MGSQTLNVQHDDHKGPLLLLALSALGVVFGDIGTSPLYALRECFGHDYGLALTNENIFGVLSLIFWTITVMISLKYVLLVLRADNRGEGGILSLMALAIKQVPQGKRRYILVMVGLLGSALLYGDGIITPAISVLSAVEGLKVVTPVFSDWVVPITVAVIFLLFLVQYFGTARIGAIFGPVILIWFMTMAAGGIYQILHGPEILAALNPIYAVEFFYHNGPAAFWVLASVFLTVTGGEALYADMGHFGRSSIQVSWYFVAMPALVLNYFGQGALLVHSPQAIDNPFFHGFPDWAQWPVVILATLAAVIASQALISGIFSITRQAVQLGYWPRVRIIHTSSREIGQIYVPFMNWALMIGVIWLVFSFKSSSALAGAYGIAVTLTAFTTTILAGVVAYKLWDWPAWRVVLIFGFFSLIDAAFVASNASKIVHGGWVPLVLGVVVYTLMSTWAYGRRILAEKLKERSVPIIEFVRKMENNPPQRVAGSAIYMAGDTWGVPVPLLHNLKHNKVLHSRVAILTIKTTEVPFVAKDERVEIEVLADNFYRIIALYGFMETPKIKHILDACREAGIPFSIQETTFVLGRETILPSGPPSLTLWREKIFAIMSRNAERPTAFFKIPPNQVIEVGIQVEI